VGKANARLAVDMASDHAVAEGSLALGQDSLQESAHRIVGHRILEVGRCSFRLVEDMGYGTAASDVNGYVIWL
jgi:hypothetical protein